MEEYRLYDVGMEDSILTMVQKLQNTIEKLVFFNISEEALFLFTEDNLNLLIHYAAEENKNLVLLTRNKSLLKSIANRLPTADSVEAFFEKSALDRDRPEQTARPSGWLKKVVFTAVMIFAFLLLAQWGLKYLYLPRVIVTVHPKILTTEVEIPIYLEDLDVKTHSTELEKTITGSASGKTIVGTHRAKGEVVFFNQDDKEIKLFKGEILKTKGGKSYRLIEDLLIPGAELVYVLDVKSSQTAGQALGFIEALELGADYNIKAGEVCLVDGKYPNLTVRNLRAVEGGKSETRPTVTQADLNKAKETVISSLNSEAVDVKEGEYLVSGTVIRLEPNVIFDVKVGDFSPTITATGTQQVTYSKVSAAEILRNAENLLPDLLPKPYNLVEDSLKITKIGFQKDLVDLKVMLDLQAYLKPEEIVASIAGRSVDEAILKMDPFSELIIEDYEDEILPTRKEWIKIVVVNAEHPPKDRITLSLNEEIYKLM